MKPIALVTDDASLSIDYDMELLQQACEANNLVVSIQRWDDLSVDWASFSMVLLRSPWTYSDRLEEFLVWCRHVSAVTRLENPLEIVEWGLDKHYLLDLEAYDVPIVPTFFIEADVSDPTDGITGFFNEHTGAREFVVKPCIGAYSKDVRRFVRDHISDAVQHVKVLHASGAAAIVQPYLDSIDQLGETDLIFFNGSFSHAIRKGALLQADGTVNVPTADFRKSRVPDQQEIAVAKAALDVTKKIFSMGGELLYARIDLIKDQSGAPVLLEMEISEPSLSLPFCEGSAVRFANEISRWLKPHHKPDRALA